MPRSSSARDPGSPDTLQKFYADVQMYADNFDGVDPEPYLSKWTCNKAPSPENQWQGENISRFCDEEYDRLVPEIGGIADAEERAEMGRRMNDMLATRALRSSRWSIAAAPRRIRTRLAACS